MSICIVDKDLMRLSYQKKEFFLKVFCRILSIEGITDQDYEHTKKYGNLSDYHDLYMQSDTLLLAECI